jgi:hypothetical protein
MLSNNGKPVDPASVTWHLDKRISVVNVITAILYLSLGAYWISGVDFRLASLERSVGNIPALENRLRTQEAKQARADERLRALTDRLARMDNKLDKLLERVGAQ